MYFLSVFTLPIRSLSRSPLSTQANSFTHSLIQVAQSFTFSPIHKLIQSPTYSFSHIFNQTFNNSLLFRHLLPTSIPYLFTNSFTHQLIHCQKRNQTFKTFNNSLLFSFTYALPPCFTYSCTQFTRSFSRKLIHSNTQSLSQSNIKNIQQ